jgi:hypothetical protein
LRQRLERVERKLAGNTVADDPEVEVNGGAAQTD